MIWVHFISVGGAPKKREGWGMYIPHPSLFFGRFNSFETHPFDFLSDPEEDIYSNTDGEPFHDEV
jgi:hypothetical protein